MYICIYIYIYMCGHLLADPGIPQGGPALPQNRVTTILDPLGPSWRQLGPTWHRLGPTWAQMAPRWPKTDPRQANMSQHGPNMAPTSPQLGPPGFHLHGPRGQKTLKQLKAFACFVKFAIL